MEPLFFENQNEFRKWLQLNYTKEKELIVGFYKVATGKPSMTWSESVDQALCFGWIDGIRRTIDEEAYSIRFTPRRTNSIWSKINIQKVEKLTKLGLMTKEGLHAYSLLAEKKSKIYAYENRIEKLSKEFEKQFKENKIAWKYFKNQAPSYKKVMVHWIMTAKQEKTKISRLEKTIAASQEEKRLR